jgi:hypothetical protein
MRDVLSGQEVTRHLEAGLDARDLWYLVATPFDRTVKEPETVLFKGLRVAIE